MKNNEVVGNRVDRLKEQAKDKVLIEDRNECIKDISDFLNIDVSDVISNINNGLYLIKQEWEYKNPKSDYEIIQFYKNTVNYLYDLTQWHFDKRRVTDIELVKYMKNVKKDNSINTLKILDFGCGIGQNSYLLAKEDFDVTIADLDSKTLNFAEYRFKKHNVPYKIWKTDIEEKAPEERYDVILAFDVFEHLTESQTQSIVDKLISLKHKDTIIILSNSFGTQGGAHPMHFDSTQTRIDKINKLLSKENYGDD